MATEPDVPATKPTGISKQLAYELALKILRYKKTKNGFNLEKEHYRKWLQEFSRKISLAPEILDAFTKRQIVPVVTADYMEKDPPPFIYTEKDGIMALHFLAGEIPDDIKFDGKITGVFKAEMFDYIGAGLGAHDEILAFTTRHLLRSKALQVNQLPTIP